MRVEGQIESLDHRGIEPFKATHLGFSSRPLRCLGELCGYKLLTAEPAKKIRKDRKEALELDGLFNDSILQSSLTLSACFRTL